MAREKMVTRTMQTTKVSVLCIDVEAETTCVNEYTVAGTYKDEKSLMKALNNVVADGIKPVAIKATEIIETLYGMTEQKFMENAVVLPPRANTENN